MIFDRFLWFVEVLAWSCDDGDLEYWDSACLAMLALLMADNS